MGLGWKALVAGTADESTSCRTCTPGSQKRMNAPGMNCPNTFKVESTTPMGWVQGLFSFTGSWNRFRMTGAGRGCGWRPS